MNISNKIKSLSEKKRKMILWFIMFIVAIFLLSIYVNSMQNALKENEGKELFNQFDFQKVQEQVGQATETIFDNIK